MIEQGFTVSGKGPAIVFLHSSLSSSKQWGNLAKQLSSSFTCINIDLLGYGKAAIVNDAENYNFNTETSRIKSILKALVPNEKYHLVGHSCGGAIGLKLAVEEPDNILSMTLFEPVAFHLLAHSHDAHHNNLALKVKQFAENIAAINNKEGAETFVDFWNGKGFYSNLPSKIQSIMAKDIEKVKLDFIGILHETYNFEALKKIQSPCLIILGQHSQEVSQVLSRAIADSLNIVELKAVQSGHMAPLSHPNLVEPAIFSFIKNV
ncbi:MAG: alpha/beta hydrolase [Thalassotalea sp.]|nr:alpha/beta hydrolase [Thalassotalea sp.]